MMRNYITQDTAEPSGCNYIILVFFSAGVIFCDVFIRNTALLSNIAGSEFLQLVSMLVLTLAAAFFSFGSVGRVTIPAISLLFGVISDITAGAIVSCTDFYRSGLNNTAVFVLLIFAYFLVSSAGMRMSAYISELVRKQTGAERRQYYKIYIPMTITFAVLTVGTVLLIGPYKFYF